MGTPKKMSALLEIKDISKRFGNLVANDKISFSQMQGEVLAILGENGAGKTTLMNILFGHYKPDSGDIVFRGSHLPAGKPGNAIEAGIGMVHQHFTLAENLTVLENIIIGEQSLLSFSLPQKSARKKLQDLSDRFGLPINPDTIVANLSVSEKQRLEILKTLYRDCTLLILDEPTAALTPQETDSLFSTIKNMVKNGLSVILISHKLNEILAVSDRIVVLRHGKLVGEVVTSKANRTEIAEMIVGGTVNYPKKEKSSPGKEVMRLENISCNPINESTKGLNGVDISLFEGQILGIAGVTGNGQTSLAKMMSGHLKPKNGEIFFDQKRIEVFNPKNFMELGVAYIPEDRNIDGLVADMSVWENAVITEISNEKLGNTLGFINNSSCNDAAQILCETYDVRTQTLQQPARLLSGGNVQKLLLGRWLIRQPKVLIACQPTRGLDEGAIASIQKLILDVRKKGNAVLLITEDLDELLKLSDTVSVIYNGKLSNSFSAEGLDRARVGLMMAGEGFND